MGDRDLREILALPAGGVQRGSGHPLGGHQSGWGLRAPGADRPLRGLELGEEAAFEVASFLRLLTTFISQQHGFKPEEL